MIHLSVRLAWHDNGWDGCICQEPHLNSSCVYHRNIRDDRDDEYEREHAGIHLSDIPTGRLPPCSRDTAAYADQGFRFIHEDPLERDFLGPTVEQIPPYTCLPAPYRWLREENFQDVCEYYGLSIRGRDNPDRERGWIYEPDRQIPLLTNFWNTVKGGEGEALVFYYVNRGNPVDDHVPRLVVGVGRLKKIGPQRFFDGTDPDGNRYPIWTRTITQQYPSQGFRLPYQEYIAQDLDPRSIACCVPGGDILPFSYVAEQVTDDVAVGVLERLIQCVRTVRTDNRVSGPWKSHLNWLNDSLAQVWQDRGAFPGIGSVLEHLGFRQGTAFQRLDLTDLVRNEDNPWHFVRSILEGHTTPPDAYRQAFAHACRRWRQLARRPARLDLLDTLVRFEMTVDQVGRICNPDERAKAGIALDEETLVANPYQICEYDLGTAQSNRVNLATIDHGLLPQGNAALLIPPEDTVAQDDARRVRAISVAALRDAADAGDTVLSLQDLLDRVREYFPERRTCHVDRDLFIADADFHREHLWLALDNDPQLAALSYLRDLEKEIARTVQRRVKRVNPPPEPAIDWHQALIDEFGDPETTRERSALAEKATALETLFRRRISVLTGSAGTGKTSALKVLLSQLERVEGKQGVYLLAPTGKARVRLSTATRRNAYTIHQFLLKHDWFLPEIFELKRDGGGQGGMPNVIIDECSMVPADLLGTLFRALKLGLVRRLILVGDPNQLPPIGPGRPFVDIVAWLEEHHPECVATLRTTMRTADEAGVGFGQSVALAFADGYRTDSVNPADDEVLVAVAHGGTYRDLEVHYWEDLDDLTGIIQDRLRELLDIGDPGDYKSFNRSLGMTSSPWQSNDWGDAERWQILSPLRIHPFGTDELNRTIQLAYRGGLIHRCQQPWSDRPRPFGDQEIVYTDKVIQTVNRRRTAWPREGHPLDYVANGEIGIVTTTDSNSYGEYLQVGFSTQDRYTYRYYRREVDQNLELAYALTIHKAQGSDFEVVFLIVPQEAQTLSRELIYTGLTRFRKRLVLLIERDVSALRTLRFPRNSATHLRNTNLFDLSLRADEPERLYPETLIHRTKSGVAVRSKSEVIVADMLDDLGIDWEYEKPLRAPDDPNDFRLPDFTVGFAGDTFYWEHLGMLTIPAHREGWARKRRWYEQRMGIPVVEKHAGESRYIEPGASPIVITSRDAEDGGIDAQHIERLARKYILLEG